VAAGSSRSERSAPEGPAAEQRKGPTTADARIAELIADLAHDDVRYNACLALTKLVGIGAPAVPQLRDALASSDHQQRQLAAMVLRRLDVPPDDLLLAVSVEGLRHDHLPHDPEADRTTPVGNATSSAPYSPLARAANSSTLASSPITRTRRSRRDEAPWGLCAS
jgi:hypothetical protein